MRSQGQQSLITPVSGVAQESISCLCMFFMTLFFSQGKALAEKLGLKTKGTSYCVHNSVLSFFCFVFFVFFVVFVAFFLLLLHR